MSAIKVLTRVPGRANVYVVSTPGGHRLEATRGEVQQWARQVGGDGYHWTEQLAHIDAMEGR